MGFYHSNKPMSKHLRVLAHYLLIAACHSPSCLLSLLPFQFDIFIYYVQSSGLLVIVRWAFHLTACTDGLSLLFYPAIFWVSLCVYPCRQELHPNNRVCSYANTQLAYFQHKICCDSQYLLSINTFSQLLNVMLGLFVMDITHYYLHTCFNFVLINTGLICMRIASVRIPKNPKTILEQRIFSDSNWGPNTYK